MSDLTDEKLVALLSSSDGAGIADTHRMVVEIGRYRSARAASVERVREVVAEAAIAVLERIGIKEPHSSSDADAIATRAAEQLATAVLGLSHADRLALSYLSGWCNANVSEVIVDPDRFGSGVAALDRLLAYPPATDLRSAILAILDSDMPAGDVRKALAELVGRR